MSEILKPIAGGYVNSTVSSTVVPLFQPSELDSDTTHVRLTIEGGELRFTLDGSDPSQTRGEPLPDSSISILSAQEAEAMRVIRGGVDDIIVHIHQFIEVG